MLSFLTTLYCYVGPFRPMDNIRDCRNFIRNNQSWTCRVKYLGTYPAYCTCTSAYDCTPSDVKDDSRYHFDIPHPLNPNDFLVISKQVKIRPISNCEQELTIMNPLPRGYWTCNNIRDILGHKKTFYCHCKAICTIEEGFVLVH